MLIPVLLSGPPAHLAGSAAVERMQVALKALAAVRKRPAIDPGVVSGEVDDPTMIALNAALGILAEELPAYVYLPLQGAFIAGGTTSYAKNLVTQYAAQLTIAINTATTKYKMSHPTQAVVVTDPVSQQSLLAQIFAPGWYMKPHGLILIAIVLFGGYKLVSSPKKVKA